MEEEHKHLYRVVTFLDRRELDLLDDLSRDIYFIHGIKVPRSKLIEEIIRGLTNKTGQDKDVLEKDILKHLNTQDDSRGKE